MNANEQGTMTYSRSLRFLNVQNLDGRMLRKNQQQRLDQGGGTETTYRTELPTSLQGEQFLPARIPDHRSLFPKPVIRVDAADHRHAQYKSQRSDVRVKECKEQHHVHSEIHICVRCGGRTSDNGC